MSADYRAEALAAIAAMRADPDNIHKTAALAIAALQVAKRERGRIRAELALLKTHSAAQADTVAALSVERDELGVVTGNLRKRIHAAERHNQYFERCESRWCNPTPTLACGGVHFDPATEPHGDRFVHEQERRIDGLKVELARKDAEIAELREENSCMSRRLAEPSGNEALRAEVERLKENIEFVTAERDGADETIKSLRSYADVQYAEVERLTKALIESRNEHYRQLLEAGCSHLDTPPDRNSILGRIDAALSPAAQPVVKESLTTQPQTATDECRNVTPCRCAAQPTPEGKKDAN